MSEHQAEDQTEAEFEALQSVVLALKRFDSETQARIIGSVQTFLQIGQAKNVFTRQSTALGTTSGVPSSGSQPGFSEDLAISPKEFLLEKQPRTDVERVACLAFYLTHYRDTPHFKTIELSKLNTEAAQPKFSNAANAASNAVKMHYLVPSTKGNRQISAAGEQFVLALPDRDAARSAMAAARPKRKIAKKRTTKK